MSCMYGHAHTCTHMHGGGTGHCEHLHIMYIHLIVLSFTLHHYTCRSFKYETTITLDSKVVDYYYYFFLNLYIVTTLHADNSCHWRVHGVYRRLLDIYCCILSHCPWMAQVHQSRSHVQGVTLKKTCIASHAAVGVQLNIYTIQHCT